MILKCKEATYDWSMEMVGAKGTRRVAVRFYMSDDIGLDECGATHKKIPISNRLGPSTTSWSISIGTNESSTDNSTVIDS